MIAAQYMLFNSQRSTMAYLLVPKFHANIIRVQEIFQTTLEKIFCKKAALVPHSTLGKLQKWTLAAKIHVYSNIVVKRRGHFSSRRGKFSNIFSNIVVLNHNPAISSKPVKLQNLSYQNTKSSVAQLLQNLCFISSSGI